MSAVPKKKPSKSRAKKRRTAWAKKHQLPEFQPCPQCEKPRLPHTVCSFCGYYNGKPVIGIKKKEKKTKEEE